MNQIARLQNELRISAAWHLRQYLNFLRGRTSVAENDRQASAEYAEYLRCKEDARPEPETDTERYWQDREENPASHAFIASMN